MPPSQEVLERAAAARRVHQRRAAEKRAADPVQLDKAIRTVIAGAPRLSAEQVATIRALLPPVRALEPVDDEPQPAA
jgi:hypothetical protein